MLTLERDDPCSVSLTRHFDAPPERVWAAHVTPVLIRRWMMGPPGWHMVRCINEARAGGRIHLEWSNGMNGSFALQGEVIEAEAPFRMLHVERLHLPGPSPDTVVETWFDRDGTGTLLRLCLTLPDAASMEAMLDGGLEAGMEESYVRLETLLAEDG